MPEINRSRPMSRSIHPDGREIIMYFDEPGVYYNAGGHPVGSDQARAMGIDVDAHLQLKKVQEFQKGQAEELAAFQRGQEVEVAKISQDATALTAQKVDPDAVPALHPLVFNDEGLLRETKSLVMAELDEPNKFSVVVKATSEVIAVPVDGAAGVAAMLSWHEDHPEAVAATLGGGGGSSELDELFDENPNVTGGQSVVRSLDDPNV